MTYITNFKRIDPAKYPLIEGESWWFISPNNAENELVIPPDAMIMCCVEGLEDFVPGEAYRVQRVDDHYGWITIQNNDSLYEIPPYIIARYFDIEPFIRGCRRPLVTIGTNVADFDPEQIFKDKERARKCQGTCKTSISDIRFK